MTVVYTSHYMEEVQALCTRIGIIDHGRLIACDTLPSLLQKLPGQIRFQVAQPSGVCGSASPPCPTQALKPENDRRLTLECRDVTGTLLRLIALLQELHFELTSIETIEPNLERVFLHLTGKTLRD